MRSIPTYNADLSATNAQFQAVVVPQRHLITYMVVTGKEGSREKARTATEEETTELVGLTPFEVTF